MAQSRVEDILESLIDGEDPSETIVPQSRVEELLEELHDAMGPSDQQVEEAVSDWLDDHPEATTTVEDGAISYAKLDSTLKGKADDVDDLKSAVASLDNAVEQLESGSLSALGASEGQVPVADGEGEWAWGDAPGGGGAVNDVQVNGVSVLDAQGVADIPIAGSGVLGLVKPAAMGITVNASGEIYTSKANSSQVKAGTAQYVPIVPTNQHEAAFYGLAKAAGDSTQSASANSVGNYTDAAKSAISTMLNGSVAVSGTTPSITALPGIRYVCGEVATLDITLPASGCFDVVFESGSTPTVLTATGVTWPSWFDATALEANTTYEISIADGYGAVMAWS